MSEMHAKNLSDTQKMLIFWASFFSLMAAGMGFAFRVIHGSSYGAELNLTNFQISQVFGASLWPIAITMIGFSLVVDRTGYKLPMYVAFGLQAISAIGTAMADSYGQLYMFAICAGLGHGIVEAVINPVCAAIYPKEKTKWLTILHASWPAGLVVGGLLIIGYDSLLGPADPEAPPVWKIHSLWMLLPVAAYGLMYLPCRMPVDERVQAGVPYIEMLREIGFLGAFLASFMMVYEIGNQVAALTSWQTPDSWFYISLGIGVAIGAAFGGYVRAIGQPLFFLLCLLMIPVATAELGTDQWIKKLMTPVLETMQLNASLALVISAFIMLIFRVFAGGILKLFSPPALLCISGLFSAVGLWWLSSATGVLIFVAFVLYALGQTYYWPCILGFVSERYPRGGALTLNTVSAIGLLSVGIIGGQLLGVAFDETIHDDVSQAQPALTEASEKDASFLWMKHKAIEPEKAKEFIAQAEGDTQQELQQAYDQADKNAGRYVLLYAARFPAILVLAFGLITLYFSLQGGYKPVDIDAVSEASME